MRPPGRVMVVPGTVVTVPGKGIIRPRTEYYFVYYVVGYIHCQLQDMSRLLAGLLIALVLLLSSVAELSPHSVNRREL